MTPNRIFAAAILGGALAATAATAQSDIDADGDGMLSLEEVLAVFPTVTEDAFTAADSSGDGMLDTEELAAAQEVGLIPQDAG